MTGDLDTESEGVDKQSVDVWNEVMDCIDDNINKFEFSDVANTDEKQPANYAEG